MVYLYDKVKISINSNDEWKVGEYMNVFHTVDT